MTDHITKPETAPAPFWLVWSESGNAPTQKHIIGREAQKEAERLAMKHRGRQFHVLRSESVTQEVITVTSIQTSFYRAGP